jgi:hypothetical protein
MATLAAFAHGSSCIYLYAASDVDNIDAELGRYNEKQAEITAHRDYTDWCRRTYHFAPHCPQHGSVEIPTEVATFFEGCDRIHHKNKECPLYEESLGGTAAPLNEDSLRAKAPLPPNMPPDQFRIAERSQRCIYGSCIDIHVGNDWSDGS